MLCDYVWRWKIHKKVDGTYVIDLHWLITTSDPLSKPSWNMTSAFLFQCLAINLIPNID